MGLRRNEVVFLLGAGASVEAGIPDSSAMVRKIKERVQADKEWRNYEGLLNYIRSAVFFAEGVHGVEHQDVSFNIERDGYSLDSGDHKM